MKEERDIRMRRDVVALQLSAIIDHICQIIDESHISHMSSAVGQGQEGGARRCSSEELDRLLKLFPGEHACHESAPSEHLSHHPLLIALIDLLCMMPVVKWSMAHSAIRYGADMEFDCSS
jgi:hypothetical protein